MALKLKLSIAQMTLLKERKGRFVETYKPGRKLMELGLIDAASEPNGYGYYSWTINAAGESVLAAQSAK